MAVRSTWHARFEVAASLLQLSGLNALSVMRELDRIIEVQTYGLVAGLSPIGSATTMSALVHITSFRCDAKFGRHRAIADIDQTAPIKLDRHGTFGIELRYAK